MAFGGGIGVATGPMAAAGGVHLYAHDPRHHVADEVVGAAGAGIGIAAAAGRAGGTNDQQIHGPSNEGRLGVPAVPAGSRVGVDAVGDPRGVGVG